MNVEVICRENNLKELLDIKLITFDSAIKLAFEKIQNESVVASWKDALSSHILNGGITELLNVPVFGCFVDKRNIEVSDVNKCLSNIWSIGGENGWYYANWLWGARGFIDKLFGGVGLRRGRKNSTKIFAGDSLDFWRVLYANKEEKRLLLYAEMKLPGEAWLEFKITNKTLYQTATFRPLGLWGRLYWYSVLPFHGLIFRNMLKKISSIK
jgi:Protein of unknown function (DUF2867)